MKGIITIGLIAVVAIGGFVVVKHTNVLHREPAQKSVMTAAVDEGDQKTWVNRLFSRNKE